MKSDTKTSPEYERFHSLLKRLVAVPHAEVKEKMDEYERQKRKKRAKGK
jgi:hypothetical protein